MNPRRAVTALTSVWIAMFSLAVFVGVASYGAPRSFLCWGDRWLVLGFGDMGIGRRSNDLLVRRWQVLRGQPRGIVKGRSFGRLETLRVGSDYLVLFPGWVPALAMAPTFLVILFARRFAKRRNSARCAECGYDLAGLPMTGLLVCPECGSASYPVIAGPVALVLPQPVIDRISNALVAVSVPPGCVLAQPVDLAISGEWGLVSVAVGCESAEVATMVATDYESYIESDESMLLMEDEAVNWLELVQRSSDERLPGADFLPPLSQTLALPRRVGFPHWVVSQARIKFRTLPRLGSEVKVTLHAIEACEGDPLRADWTQMVSPAQILRVRLE